MAEEFAGLPRGMIGFLAGLEANNARDWFEAHRADYEALWLTPGLDLAAALSGPVAKMGLMAVPKLNGSLRRIHRDTRFSPDKRPYAPHLHLILSAGPAFNRAAGVHLVFGPDGFGHGVGQWAPEPAQLETLRRAFCDPAARAAFLALAAKAEALGESLGPPDLARLPKAFAGEAGDWTHLLRRKSIVMRTRGATPLPDWLFGPECLEGLEALVADLALLALWLKAQG